MGPRVWNKAELQGKDSEVIKRPRDVRERDMEVKKWGWISAYWSGVGRDGRFEDC